MMIRRALLLVLALLPTVVSAQAPRVLAHLVSIVGVIGSLSRASGFWVFVICALSIFAPSSSESIDVRRVGSGSSFTLFSRWHKMIIPSVDAQAGGYTLAVGLFEGTDQEIQECYFGINGGAMLVLHPNGEPCVIARGLIGRTGKLMFVPDP